MIIWKYVTNPKFLPSDYVVKHEIGLKSLHDMLEDRRYDQELECYSFGNCDACCEKEDQALCDDFNYYMQMLESGLL